MNYLKKYLVHCLKNIACFALFLFLCTSVHGMENKEAAMESIEEETPNSPEPEAEDQKNEAENQSINRRFSKLKLSTVPSASNDRDCPPSASSDEQSPKSRKKGELGDLKLPYERYFHGTSDSNSRQSFSLILGSRKLKKSESHPDSIIRDEGSVSRLTNGITKLDGDSDSEDSWKPELYTPRPDSEEKKILDQLLQKIHSGDFNEVETFLKNQDIIALLSIHSKRQAVHYAIDLYYPAIIVYLIKHPEFTKAITPRFLLEELIIKIKETKGLNFFRTLILNFSFNPETIQAIFIQALEAGDKDLISDILRRIKLGQFCGRNFARMSPAQAHRITIQSWRNNYKPQLNEALINDLNIQDLLANEVDKGDEKRYLELCCCLGDQVIFLSNYLSKLLSAKSHSVYLEKIIHIFSNSSFIAHITPLIHHNQDLQQLLDKLFSKIFTQIPKIFIYKRQPFKEDKEEKPIYKDSKEEVMFIQAVGLFFRDDIYRYLNRENVRSLCSNASIIGMLRHHLITRQTIPVPNFEEPIEEKEEEFFLEFSRYSSSTIDPLSNPSSQRSSGQPSFFLSESPSRSPRHSPHPTPPQNGRALAPQQPGAPGSSDCCCCTIL